MSQWPDPSDGLWAGEERHRAILEQYKLYVDIADRAATRRMAANAWWMSLQTALVGGAAYLWANPPPADHPLTAQAVSAAGVALAILWLLWLLAYARVAYVKGQLIHAIEESLPLQVWHVEDDARRPQPSAVPRASLKPVHSIKPSAWWKFWHRLQMTRVEWVLPVTCMIIHGVLIYAALNPTSTQPAPHPHRCSSPSCSGAPASPSTVPPASPGDTADQGPAARSGHALSPSPHGASSSEPQPTESEVIDEALGGPSNHEAIAHALGHAWPLEP